MSRPSSGITVGCPARRDSTAADASALIHRAFTSTGFPTRGVTATPSTRASIHVNASPSDPWVSSPSSVALIPNRVPVRWAPTTERSFGAISAARSMSPVAATCRSSAYANHSVPSTLLNRSSPVSAVFASIPSDSVAAYARSSARPSSTRPVARNSPG